MCRACPKLPIAPDPRRGGRQWIDFAIIAGLPIALAMSLIGRDSRDAPIDRGQPASLVVLPFEDLSAGGDQEYFAHGVEATTP